MSTGRTGRSLALKLAIALASTLLFIAFLALCELGARAVGLKKGFFLYPSRASCFRRSPTLGLEFRPNCVVEGWGSVWRFNSAALCGPELRSDGSRRILSIGDSCTIGWGVKSGESYPDVLQRLLDEKHGRNRYQVLNAGVPGYTSYQGLVYLRERGLALNPAAVIIGFGYNDAIKSGDAEERIAQERRLMSVLRVDDFLLEYSTLYGWLRWQGRPIAEKDLPVRVPPERYRRNLAEMVRLAREHGVHAMLLRFVEPSPDQLQYVNALADVARDLNVPLLTYEGPRLDVVHPTAEGYEKFAAQLLERLEQKGFLTD